MGTGNSSALVIRPSSQVNRIQLLDLLQIAKEQLAAAYRLKLRDDPMSAKVVTAHGTVHSLIDIVRG